MYRVAVYTRVSTEDQAKEGFSLGAQLERLESYCEAQGWEVAEKYIDDGHSGRNTRRPAYQRMMAEKEKWDIILVLKMDRIHRNSKNFMIMMENLEKWGKKFTSMNESLDTSNAVGRFVVDIIQRIAQLESEQIGERTYMGMRQKAESLDGMLGFNAPYGYHMDHEDLRIVPDEAAEVKKVFTEYLAGKTMASIVADMNTRGVMTRRGNEWSVWSISRMLHNPVYAGNLRWDGLLLPSPHDRIVDMELFNSVQSMMAGKVRCRSSRSYCQLREHDAVAKADDFKVKMT